MIDLHAPCHPHVCEPCHVRRQHGWTECNLENVIDREVDTTRVAVCQNVSGTRCTVQRIEKQDIEYDLVERVSYPELPDAQYIAREQLQ